MRDARLTEQILSGDGLPLRPDTAAYLLAFHRELTHPLRLRQLLAAEPALLIAAVRMHAEARPDVLPSLEELAAIATRDKFWERIADCNVIRLDRDVQPTLCRIWRYGAASAFLARRLAGPHHHEHGSKAFVAAWVRCVGLYALVLHDPRRWEQIRSQATDPEDLLEREADTFGIDHFALAVQLAVRWGLTVECFFDTDAKLPSTWHQEQQLPTPPALAAVASRLIDASPFRLTSLARRGAPVIDSLDLDGVTHSIATAERLLAESRRDRAGCCDWLREGASLAVRQLSAEIRNRWDQELKRIDASRSLLPLPDVVDQVARAVAIGLGAECAVLLQTPNQGDWSAHADRSRSGPSALVPEEPADREGGLLPEEFRRSGEPNVWTVDGTGWCLRVAVSRGAVLPKDQVDQVLDAVKETLDRYFSERRKIELEAQLATERLQGRRRVANLAEQKAWQALVEMAYGAGHELNNRMGVIAGRAELLLESEQDEQRRLWLTQIQQEVGRVRELLERLYDMADPPDPDLTQVDVNVLLRKAIAVAEDRCPDARLRVRIEEPADRLFLWVDPEMAAAALAELICNALQHTGSDTDVLLSAEPMGPDRAVVRVQDWGQGFSERDLTLAWVPFYCGKEAGRQPGFGLGIARRFIEAQGGRLRVLSGPHGTTVEAILLLRPPDQSARLRCA